MSCPPPSGHHPFKNVQVKSLGVFVRLKIIYIKNVHTFLNYILEWLLFNLAALGISAKRCARLRETLWILLFMNILCFAHISGLLGLIEEYCIKLIGLFIN